MTEPKSILFTCCECGKETTEVYPAYNHPEAPPICFDCLSDEEKEQSIDKETAGDMKYHALKDEGLLDRFGRRKDANRT